MRHAKFAIAALVLAVSACAGTGLRIDDAQKITAGMTPSEVEAIVGKPTTVTISGNRMIYAWGQANLFSGTSRGLAVQFVDGRVVDPPTITRRE